MTQLLAVYGTLREGGVNHYYLKHATYRGTQILDGWELNIGMLPMARRSHNDKSWIKIEVYEVSEQHMRLINQLEGYNPATKKQENSYGYQQVEVNTCFGEAVMFACNFNGPAMIEGDYNTSRKEWNQVWQS